MYEVVFDIETVPDVDLGRRMLGLGPEADAETVARRLAEAAAPHGRGFLKPVFHRVVAVAAAVLDDSGQLRRLAALGVPGDPEAVLVAEFFRVVREARPRLIGWNSGGFDLPVLVYRALRHRVAAPEFYAAAYRRRFDESMHLDLMDSLSGFGASPRVALDEMAALLGVPGKLDMDGRDVWSHWLDGDVAGIRAYCELDVLTTTLIYARYAFHRGWYDAERAARCEASVRAFLAGREEPHWVRFRQRWEALEAPEDAASGREPA
ncbi:Polysaccharide biosynthesis protein WlaX [Candidatus Hydrogenisulfobacillus filiaventi]|uniref:Polysaccharide biosynthesis protein WlaX n=1 Tax=Candidatus Hydrogenisulfobacillus filiaventi TaxID=2707344 RepID=A0A6F8ZJ21_9FIRM|nr:3'-5' exonuclease [Bacillota bacterium]CAB1129879.1 Polysaccharide biosynthesis protein WlaX [Candidatus Hydrogenisulfobacillus filiaventi]